MAAVRKFQDLMAWQKARALVREIYGLTSDKMFERDWAFRDQLRRSAISTMSNIAEGFARKGDVEFARFLDIARGSAAEVQSLLFVASDVGYLNREGFARLNALVEETQAIIGGLTSYLRKERTK